MNALAQVMSSQLSGSPVALSAWRQRLSVLGVTGRVPLVSARVPVLHFQTQKMKYPSNIETKPPARAT
jgi:hypothetical protein